MVIRTFYWDPAMRRRRFAAWRRSTKWRVGNAGDVYNRELLDHLYPGIGHRIVESGPRLLMVGSVAHRITDRDVVVGVGTKGKPVPTADRAAVTVLGVRGPITYDAFVAAGHDMNSVRFQFDPGLMITRILPPAVLDTDPERGRAIFIPHFRDPHDVMVGAGSVARIGVDCEAASLAREILRAELVYSSSLHGIIFSHALGRPCVAIRPASAEPLIKYDDYFASVGLSTRLHDSLDEAVRSPKPDSPIDQSWTALEEAFPSLDELRALGVAG